MSELQVTMRRIEVRADQRGFVFEPVVPDQLSGQRNAHFVWTEPGAIRGNHYHRKGTEIAAIMGPALVRFKAGDEIQDVTVPAGEVLQFVFPPGVAHAMKNIGDRPMCMVAFNTVAHDRAEPDVYPEKLIE